MFSGKKQLLYHIYWGTAGNAGLYLDEIYQCLSKAGFNQKVFVNFYYPFDYGEKVFFKRTEMEHTRYKGKRRKIMQAIELVSALIKILICARIEKPKIVNYSYVSSGNVLLLFFLKLIKKVSGCYLVITCHDVVPFANVKKRFDKEITIKRKIYALADYYLIHNKESIKDLKSLFGVNENKVLQHSFPLMDLSKLDTNHEESEIKFDFLFIGHMRREKGLDLLVEAWQEFHKQNPTKTLCIAGNPDYYKEYLDERKDSLKDIGVTLILGFIKDNDYINIVKSARCVIFPYTAGTNSGVISTVASLRRDVITSDISMFSANPFVPQDNMFHAKSVPALTNKLTDYISDNLVSDSEERISLYRMTFDKELIDVYNFLIKQ